MGLLAEIEEVEVESQGEADYDSRKNDIAKAEHRMRCFRWVSARSWRSGEDELNGDV
jgi:hypothetical protein